MCLTTRRVNVSPAFRGTEQPITIIDPGRGEFARTQFANRNVGELSGVDVRVLVGRHTDVQIFS